jgi:NTP pyrophosphatase (non-canonical NTP hydrolase)
MTIPGYMGMDLPILEQAVITWHNDRNLINGSTDQAQLAKLTEEVGELARALRKEKPFANYQTADAIGDILVVLINIAERNALDLRVCLHRAFNDIKERKGKIMFGIYVKEEDLG